MELVKGQVAGAGVPTMVGVPGKGATVEVKPGLKPILGGGSVKVTEMSEMERLVLESQYETAKHTIDNMVDSPEVRKMKEIRERERREDDDEREMLDKEQTDKEIEKQAMSDEIVSKRKEPV